ncbi:MAG: hypothetical protein ACUVQR_01375 [Thermogutta sp.]
MTIEHIMGDSKLSPYQSGSKLPHSKIKAAASSRTPKPPAIPMRLAPHRPLLQQRIAEENAAFASGSRLHGFTLLNNCANTNFRPVKCYRQFKPAGETRIPEKSANAI